MKKPLKSTNQNPLLLVPLWASAFILTGLVIWQAGQANLGNVAKAEMSSVGSEFSMLTTDSGNGEYLTILNGRDGNLYVYEVTTSKGVVLVDRVQMAEFIKRTGNKPNN